MKEKITFLILIFTLVAALAAGCGESSEPAALTEQAVPEASAPETVPETYLHYTPTETVTTDFLTVSIDSASPTGLQIRYQIHGDAPTVNTVMDGAYTLEKETDSGWEPLPTRQENPHFQADTVYGTRDPQFWNDSFLDFTQLYGLLQPGQYRVHWQLLEGQEPETIPFTVANRQDPEENRAIDRLLSALDALVNQERYHIKTTLERPDHAPSYRQYYKRGQDYLTIGHHNSQGAPNMDSGILLRDGVSYQLTHKNTTTNDSPIYGWEAKALLPPGMLAEGWIPSLKGFEKAEFTEISPQTLSLRYELQTLDPNSPQPWQAMTFRFDGEGRLTAMEAVKAEYHTTAPDYYQEFLYSRNTEILDFQDAGDMIDAQVPAQPRVFSWEEEQKQRQPDTRAFRNTQPRKVSSAADALQLALQECSVKYDGTMVYYDPEADIWKVEFQILYGYQGYEYIYLTGSGITEMIASGQPRAS